MVCDLGFRTIAVGFRVWVQGFGLWVQGFRFESSRVLDVGLRNLCAWAASWWSLYGTSLTPLGLRDLGLK